MSKLRAFCEGNWVLIIGAVAIVPFIAISFFNHPSSDDYCYTVQSIKLGFCKAQLSTYNEWSGRYFATAILSINPLAFGWMNGYKILPIIILILIKLSTGGNIHNAYKDLIKGNAYRYDKQVSLRYEKIHNCRETICELERISNHPSTLFWDDITSDEKHWVNQCVGDYFNKTLRLKSSL